MSSPNWEPCGICKKPWCDETWHTAQEEDIRAAAKYHHPTLLMTKWKGDLRKKRKAEYEQLERQRQQTLQRARTGLNRAEISSASISDQVCFAVVDDDSSGLLLQAPCRLPGFENKKNVHGYLIGFPREELSEDVGLIVLLPNYENGSIDPCYPCLCPTRYLPKSVLSKRRDMLKGSKDIGSYNHQIYCHAENGIKKMDGTPCVFFTFLKAIVDADLLDSLQNGLVFTRKKKDDKWMFKLIAKKNFWMREEPNVHLPVVKIDTRENQSSDALHFRLVRKGALDQEKKALIKEVCRETKFQMGIQCNGKNALLKALENVTRSLDEPTLREQCIAYLLSGVHQARAIGNVIPCVGRIEYEKHYHYGVCTCDIDESSTSNMVLKRNIKRNKDKHSRDK